MNLEKWILLFALSLRGSYGGVMEGVRWNDVCMCQEHGGYALIIPIIIEKSSQAHSMGNLKPCESDHRKYVRKGRSSDIICVERE
jgi:hypothetical protein